MIVDKPWGHEEIWAKTDKYVGKVLFITAGHQLSLQYHKIKEETIRILSGEMELNIQDGESNSWLYLRPGDVYHIRPGVVHRMRAVTDCSVMEVSTPELEDVVRLADDYGR